MKLLERHFDFNAVSGHKGILSHIKDKLDSFPKDGSLPVRFAITCLGDAHYRCELGVLDETRSIVDIDVESIFRFVPRKILRNDSFNVAFIIPTGIGSEIGGHAGDATPAARVMASACDRLILHPNVVNASDLNEMPENALYVEGSTIARLLMGTAGLQTVRSNRVLVIIDAHEIDMFANDTINAVSAGRATYGIEIPAVIKLDPPLSMNGAFTDSGRASGVVTGLERICSIIDGHDGLFDAVAVSSVIDVPDAYHEAYFKSSGEMTNPWGGVEALFTHALSLIYNFPTAHSPMMESRKVADFDLGIVEPRLAAEAVSMTFLQCMLKGLHRSPKIVTDPEDMREPGILTAADISCLVTPDKCIGLPLLAALEQGIPVIAVRENENFMKNDLRDLPWATGQLHLVENYWEAIGVMTAIKAGITPQSLRRPIPPTVIKNS